MCNRKNILTLATLILCAFTIHAQDITTLSYSEIDSLTEVQYQKGNYKGAIPYMQAGRAKAKKEFGTQDSTYAAYTAELGFFYNMSGEAKLAEPLYIEVIKIKEKVLGKNHPQLAEFILNLASLYVNMGEYEQALPLFLQTKNIWGKSLGIEHPDYALSLNNLAFLYKSMGQYEQALPLYIQAKNIRAKALGVEHLDYAFSLNNLASLYKSMGQYEQALPLYIQAKNSFAKSLGVEHPSYGTSLNNLASLYKSMGYYEQALPLYIQAKNIRANSLGLTHPSYALALNNLATLYQSMGQFEQALPLFLQAKDIFPKSLGIEHPDYSTSLNNLASLYQNMGQYERAWEIIKEAITASSKLELHNALNSSWADSLLHADYSSNEHLEEMIRSLEIIYSLVEKDNVVGYKEKQIILSDLADALLIQLRDKHGGNDDKLRMLSKSSDWLLKSLKVLDKNKDAYKAFEKAEQNKSVLLLEAVKSEKAYQLGYLPDSLLRKEQDLIQKRDKLQANLLQKSPEAEKDSLRNLLIAVNQDLNKLIVKIEKDYPKYAAFKYKNVDVKAKDIQQLLNEKTALLEYVIGDSVVYIFYLDKKQLQITEQAIGKNKLKQEIKQLHEALSNYNALVETPEEAYQRYTSSAHWCYQNLVAPILKNAKGIEQLIIITDGELGHLPFEAFLVDAAPAAESSYADLHYLLRDYAISYNYSATLWKENKEAVRPKNNGQMLGIAANYTMKADSTISMQRSAYRGLRDALSPLPAARQEMELLSKRFKGLFAFDSLASERFFKAEASKYAVIHLAMHGLLDSHAPILSSLAFSEDGDSLENNFLQAYEISKMELNADLVVLSACETGFGKFEKGNGIASLARAFMYAGAPALVVSLWQVNDHATALLMEQFYDNLAKGMDKAEALQQAKLTYITKGNDIAAHPAFWSPFILMGDTAPIRVQTRLIASVRVWWAIGGGAVLLLLGGLVWRKRKRTEI